MRRAPGVVALVVLLGASAVCVRLGFWQLSRLEEKRSLNAVRSRALSQPPIEAGSQPPPIEQVEGRLAAFTGRFDTTGHVLLAGRAHRGSPGVEVVTPLRLDVGGVVLVNRGWVTAPDAATADPARYAEPGRLRVVGVVERIGRGLGGAAWREVAGGRAYSARRLDGDTLAARLSYAVPPYVVRQVPGPGVPASPVRSLPQPLDETMHLSYAIQWFAFAAILVLGPPLVWLSGRSRRGRDLAGHPGTGAV